jgi:predicted outer membrane repeat protein
MDYFRSYSPSADAGIVAAWDSQVAQASDVPSLRSLLAERGSKLFPEFAKRYNQIRTMPRSTRRALQRRLAHSRELTAIPTECRRKLTYSIAGAALLLALTQAAQAATINVTTNNTNINTADGKCSLIEAIISANTDTAYGGCVSGSGADIIQLSSGMHALTYSFVDYVGYNGLPLITSEITITGKNSTILRKSNDYLRLVSVANGGKLTIQGTTLTKGDLFIGGAILNFGELTIESCTISGNFSFDRGGAIFSEGTVTISHSTLSNNKTRFGVGGAFYNAASAGNGILTVDYTDFIGNHSGSTGAGGALWSNGLYADINISNSRFVNNEAPSGGAIFVNGGYTRLANSIITGNRATFIAGGIGFAFVTLSIENSAIAKNLAVANGGGVYIYGGYPSSVANTLITGNKASYGGGIYARNATLSIDRSTISKNTSQLGGGVGLYKGEVEVSDSTITGNKAGAGPGGGVASNESALHIDQSTISKNSAFNGGGVQNADGTFTLSNSTVTANKATNRGGGVDNSGTSPVFSNTGNTISGNKAPTGPNVNP